MEEHYLNVVISYIIVCLAFALTTYLTFLWYFKTTKQNLPPGPRGWKAVLDIFRATHTYTLHELATKWAKQYGPITYVSFLGKPMVFLNTPDMTRRVMASDATKHMLSNRVPNAASKLAWFNGKDLMFTPFDAIARKKRRMFYNVIGLYGDGTATFEKVVSEEMDRFFMEIEQYENQDFEFTKHISRSIKIVIYVLALGECPDDISKPDILEEYDIAFNKLWAPDIDFVLTNIPLLEKFPGRYKNAVQRLRVAKQAAEELIYFTPKKSWKPGEPRGIADLLFDLQNKPGNEWMKNDHEHVIAFLTSLFLAAHLSSRATITAGFLCFLNNPKKMKNVQEEIDRVLGNRLPKVEDRANMPYTESAILETLRLITQIPLSGFRIASVDIEIDGMIIPKDALVLNTNWYYHHNEELWKDPWAFKPERFLDSSGQILPADDPIRRNLIPFGLGTRSCPGEVFARSRAFMYFTRVLQKYDLFPPENGQLISADFQINHEESQGFLRLPPSYCCRLRERQHKS